MSGTPEYCPISMGADLIGERWNLLIIREILTGASRFNDIHRGLPSLSRTLMSRRLQTLQQSGLVERIPVEEGEVGYRVTEAGADLIPVLLAIGEWTVRWRFPEPRDDQLNAHLLLWRMQARLAHERLPERRVIIEFTFTGPQPEQGWLILDGADSSICARHPGFDVDLHAVATSRVWHATWHGHRSIDQAIADGEIELTGAPELVARFGEWFKLAHFVDQVAARRGDGTNGN